MIGDPDFPTIEQIRTARALCAGVEARPPNGDTCTALEAVAWMACMALGRMLDAEIARHEREQAAAPQQ